MLATLRDYSHLPGHVSLCLALLGLGVYNEFEKTALEESISNYSDCLHFLS